MKTVVAKLYEGMFLVDSALAASDFEGVNDAVRAILERAGAEIVSMKKWDERRLAYDINGKSRGTYILTFFRVDGKKITDIERAVRLSEKIMRVLILNTEGRDQEYIDKETAAPAEEKEVAGSSESTEDSSGSDEKQQESEQEQKQQ